MCLARSPWCMFLNCAKLFSGNLYGYVDVVNKAKIIYKVLLASEKIEKNLGGRLELLISIYTVIQPVVILCQFMNILECPSS